MRSFMAIRVCIEVNYVFLLWPSTRTIDPKHWTLDPSGVLDAVRTMANSTGPAALQMRNIERLT